MSLTILLIAQGSLFANGQRNFVKQSKRKPYIRGSIHDYRQRTKSKFERAPTRWAKTGRARFVPLHKLSYLNLLPEIGGIRTSIRGNVAVITTYQPHRKYSDNGELLEKGFEVRRFATTLLQRDFDTGDMKNLANRRKQIEEADVWFSLAIEKILELSLYEIPVEDMYDGVHAELLRVVTFPGKFSHRALLQGAIGGTYDIYAKLIPIVDPKSTNNTNTTKVDNDKKPLLHASILTQINSRGSLAYIKIPTFVGENKEVSIAFEKAVTKAWEMGSEGVLLDLRGNGGGNLHDALDLVKLFANNSSPIFFSVGKNDKIVYFAVKSPGSLADIPLVILVDKKTASASESVAGALQKMGKAVVVGETTFGKGIIQTTTEINEDMKFKLTSSMGRFGDDSNYHIDGVHPDVRVSGSEKQDSVLRAGQLSLEKIISEKKKTKR